MSELDYDEDPDVAAARAAWVAAMIANTPELDVGATLLDELHTVVTKYCVLPSPDHEHAVVLWIATTHCVAAFDYATRLVIRSAEKRSGKSRLLEIIDGTCHQPLRAINATTPAIFRSLDGDQPPTILVDEADSIFGTKRSAENNEDLRGLFNAGFQRGLPVLRTVGPHHVPTAFPTFAMLALAGIGRMPDTIEDRAVVVPMRRRKLTEPVTAFRLRHNLPELHNVRDQLAAWAPLIVGDLEGADPDMPVTDRAADTWAPLVAVADAAGGHWPARARAAALRLTEDADQDSAAESEGQQLLRDMRDLFDGLHLTFATSKHVCEYLNTLEESPWHDLNPSKLGQRLRPYGVKTGHDTSRKQRGYRIEDLRDAFDRYLPPQASEGVQRRPQAPDLQKHQDAFEKMDAFKTSEEHKASRQNRRSEAQ